MGRPPRTPHHDAPNPSRALGVDGLSEEEIAALSAEQTVEPTLEQRRADALHNHARTGQIALMITDEIGDVLHLGRSQRLASRAQRRALRLRDRTCVFPGCHQCEHLDAHHTTPWSKGGLTDIEDLALLCRRHHVMVHEGGLRCSSTS